MSVAVCDFCNEPGEGGSFVADHDHETGRIRGIVHQRCNTRIGSWTKANVQRLVEYLNRDADLGSYARRTVISLTASDEAAVMRIMARHPELRTRNEAVSLAIHEKDRAGQLAA